MDATHLLITRFNVRFLKVAPREYPCDDTWHRHRIKIFERFCLPSVLHQTNQDFRWLIFFNSDLRDQYLEFIDRTQSASANIIFIFVDPGTSHLEMLNRYIGDHVHTKHVITTRMDNDDLISSRFVETIQTCYRKHASITDDQNFILNAPEGYQLETSFPHRRSRITGYACSPFISLVSDKDEATNGMHVHKYKHPDWKGKVESVDISDEPLWIQVIHNRNRANRILTFDLRPEINTKEFPALDKSGTRTAPHNLLLPVQFLMTALQRIYVKLIKMLRR